LTSNREATWTMSCHSNAADHARGAAATDRCASSRRRVLTALGTTALAATFGAGRGVAFAQDSSSRLARIIVPFAPGAAVDVVARMLASGLSAQWGKTVIVENRPGGRTLIAAEAVARSEQDGDTLLFCLDDTFTIVPHLSKNASFDPMKELVPVNLVGTIPMAFVVNPSVPADSIPALITYARNNPTALSYGSSGSGSLPHLAMEMLKSQANINIVHVPYRGLAPAMTAVVAGEVQTAILGFGSSRSMIESGRLRAIAIASPARVASSPNIPTTGELGYGKVDATSRLTLAGPARMSAETIGRVNDAVSNVLNSPEMRKQIEARDIVVTNMGPKPFAEIERISRLNAEAVRISGAQAE
jgi:tripartite-type tricarboxylate transporter receptor subunit TctC